MLFEEQMTRNANARGLMDKDVLSQISPVIDYFVPRKHRGKKKSALTKKIYFSRTTPIFLRQKSPAFRSGFFSKATILETIRYDQSSWFKRSRDTFRPDLRSIHLVRPFSQEWVKRSSDITLSDRTWNWIKVNHGHPKWLFSLILLKGLHDVPTWKL